MIKNKEIIGTQDSYVSKEHKVARVDQLTFGKVLEDIFAILFTFKLTNKIPLQELIFSWEFKILS